MRNPHQSPCMIPVNHSPAWTPGAVRRFTSPHARTDAAGRATDGPGSLKAPETANDKLTALDAFRKGSENYALTTNQGVRIADDQILFAPAAAALRCWKILSCARKLPTLTMSASRRGSFTPADLQRTAISSHIKT